MGKQGRQSIQLTKEIAEMPLTPWYKLTDQEFFGVLITLACLAAAYATEQDLYFQDFPKNTTFALFVAAAGLGFLCTLRSILSRR